MTAKYKDAEAILDELELFLPEEMLAGVDETLEGLLKDLKDDDPEVKKKFNVLISTLAELMREHAESNPGDLEELERVLEVTKRIIIQPFTMEVNPTISLKQAEREREQAERRASIEKVEIWLKMQEGEKVLDLVEKLGPREAIVRANAQIRLMLEACEAGEMDDARRIRDEMMAELAEWVRIHGQE
ncbi:hypothetical protein BJX65DRAFT_308310 [Aspergillus insuetus]